MKYVIHFSAFLLCLFLNHHSLAEEITRRVTPLSESEHPGFSIAREFEKYRDQYPFIRPIKIAKSGNFLAYPGLVYHSSKNRELHLELYRPVDNGQGYPAVVLVHGGGWRTGDRGHQVPMAQELAAVGYVGVAVEYRLSGEALYPTGFLDLQAAIRWLRRHAAEFAIDPDRIAILGASSGAHMATLAGVVGNMDTFAGSATIENGINSAVQAIINVDGVVELLSPEVRSFEDNPDKASAMGLWLGGRYHELPDLWREVSPLNYAGKQTPPTLFINSALPRFHAGRDEFISILKQYGTYTEVHTIPDTPHPFWLFHPWFDQERDILIDFLDRVFKGKPRLEESS